MYCVLCLRVRRASSPKRGKNSKFRCREVLRIFGSCKGGSKGGNKASVVRKCVANKELTNKK